jgi:hypothetical protein
VPYGCPEIGALLVRTLFYLKNAGHDFGKAGFMFVTSTATDQLMAMTLCSRREAHITKGAPA